MVESNTTAGSGSSVTVTSSGLPLVLCPTSWHSPSASVTVLVGPPATDTLKVALVPDLQTVSSPRTAGGVLTRKLGLDGPVPGAVAGFDDSLQPQAMNAATAASVGLPNERRTERDTVSSGGRGVASRRNPQEHGRQRGESKA